MIEFNIEKMEVSEGKLTLVLKFEDRTDTVYFSKKESKKIKGIFSMLMQ